MGTIIHNWKPSARLIRLAEKQGVDLNNLHIDTDLDRFHGSFEEVRIKLLGRVNNRFILSAGRICKMNDLDLVGLQNALDLPFDNFREKINYTRNVGIGTYNALRAALLE